jgi:hypothetical protein
MIGMHHHTQLQIMFTHTLLLKPTKKRAKKKFHVPERRKLTTVSILSPPKIKRLLTVNCLEM